MTIPTIPLYSSTFTPNPSSPTYCRLIIIPLGGVVVIVILVLVVVFFNANVTYRYQSVVVGRIG